MNRIRFVLIPLILLILTACSPAPAAGKQVTPSVTLPSTWTPTATATTNPTFTPTPTASPTPTLTPTPTPITLPVTNGTPVPDLPYEVITVENVYRLRQIARYGYPSLLDEKPYRLTADGKTIVVGTTLGPEFYDARTHEKTGGFEVEFLHSFDLTPDGQYLLTFAGETLTVWTRDGTVGELAEPQKVREFDLEIGDAWELNPVAISPDGALLAVQRKKADWQEIDRMDVYRVQDGSLLDTVRGSGVVFSPDGQYLATVFGPVQLYPVAELGKGWERHLPKTNLPWCSWWERCGIVFSPDGTLAALVFTARVDVYRVAERRLVRQVSGWEADQYHLPQVQFSADGGQMLITTPTVYVGWGKVKAKAQVIAVDIATGEWLSRSERESEVEEGFAYLDGGQVRTFQWVKESGELSEPVDWFHFDLGVDNHGQTRLVYKGSIETEKQKFIPKGYCASWYSRYGSLWAVLCLPCGARQIYHSDLRVVIYDEKSSKTVLIKDGGDPSALSDEILILTGPYEGIKVWSLDGKNHSTYDVEYNDVEYVHFTSAAINGKLAFAGGSEGELVALAVDYGEITKVAVTGSRISGMAFSPDGRFLATSESGGFTRVWAVVP